MGQHQPFNIPTLQHSNTPLLTPPRTLLTELRQQQRLSPTDAAQLTLRLAGALAHLHSHGLVHRDIKPGKRHLR
jgi:serine/threonine protein kinase